MSGEWTWADSDMAWAGEATDGGTEITIRTDSDAGEIELRDDAGRGGAIPWDGRDETIPTPDAARAIVDRIA